jgi:hypothetical protein
VKPVYEFAEKMSLTPYKKSYGINDTISVQFQTTDRKLFDKLSNTRIPTDTTYIALPFYYHQLYPATTNPNDTLCIAFVVNGSNQRYQTAQAYNMMYAETICGSGPYFIKFVFIPKKKGIFSIELPSGTHVSNCPNKLSSFPIATCVFTYDLPDCNHDVYLTIPESSRSVNVNDRIEKKEVFVFKVE